MIDARFLLALALALGTAACTPTPQAGGGGGGNGVNAACSFAPNQTSQDLRMNCTVSGSPPNRLLNPASGGSGCKFESLSLFGQTVSAQATFIYGENGDENSGRVRIGVRVADGASHGGRLGKSAGDGCSQTVGPIVTVDTRFGGTHVALVDKGQIPMCVFESRFSPSAFTQTVSAGLSVDASAVTRDASVDAIARTLDLEAARAVNRLLAPSATLDAAFVARAGRCANGWQAFTGN